MSVEIDPIIVKKLDDFGRRRRNLIILRGLCSLIVSLLGVFTIIAVIDYVSQGHLPDQVRTGASILGYVIVVYSVWKTCIRLLGHLPNKRQMARLVEQTTPELREDLLSAVELGRPTGTPTNDSEDFRKLVQKDVAGRVKGLDISGV